MRYSLQTRLAVSYIGLGLIPLCLLGLIFIGLSLQYQLNQAYSVETEVARRVAAESTTFIKQLEFDLQTTLQTQNLANANLTQQKNILNVIQSYENGLEELALLDATGQETVRTSRLFIVPDAQLRNRSQLDEFRIPKNTRQVYYSPVYISKMTGEPEMVLALPVIDGTTHDVEQVLVATIQFRVVWNLIANIQVDDGEQVYILDDNGVVVAHNNASVVVRKINFESNSTLDNYLGLETRTILESPSAAGIHSGLDKDTTVVLATKSITFGSHKYIVVAERLLPQALPLAIDATIVIIVIILATLIVAIGLALRVISQIMQPIQTLVTTVQSISAGDLTKQIVITSQDELGILGQAFNAMSAELRNSIETLEQRVRQRTKALETTAEISRQITTILEIDELLKYIVARLHVEFQLYHLQIYLLHEETHTLVAHHGHGDIGQLLQAQHHAYALGAGIVGQAWEANQAILVNDVTTKANFSPIALLPQTQAELAVPLHKGKQLLGMLDLLSDQRDHFSEADVSLIQTIADQVAVALDNLRQFAKMETVLKEVERLNRRLTRESWETSLAEDENPTIGYEFKRGMLKPLKQVDSLVSPETALLAQPAQLSQELAVPLMLRGESIGLLKVKRSENPHWKAEELTAVDAVANQISLALENARLSTEQEKTIGKLQELDRLKSEFLTSMSHELRTPLNAILGFADVLLQGIDGELTDYALNDVQLIYNSGQHLLTLINDILDISKIEAGMMEIVPEPLEILPVVKEVVAASDSLIKNKAVSIFTDITPDYPEAYADNIRLKQILLNLVGNAAKFTEKGSITILTKVLPHEPTMMRFIVADTGIGIPQNKLSAIFERFKQADMSTTRVYGGTGLGLAICKQLVEMHGGRIWVESQEGVGSEFHFTIPLMQAEKSEN